MIPVCIIGITIQKPLKNINIDSIINWKKKVIASYGVVGIAKPHTI